jgi:hypothetical protein
MWRPYLVTPGADAFEAALSGQSSTPAAEALAQFITKVAGAVRITDVPVPEEARRRMLGLVATTAPAEASTPFMKTGPRGAALAAATMAGGGLLIASATTGTNPVELVREAVHDLPSFTLPGADPGTASPAAQRQEVVVSGRITGLTGDGMTIEGRERLQVYFSQRTVFHGRPALGLDARVRGMRDGDGVDAIEVTIVAASGVAPGTAEATSGGEGGQPRQDPTGAAPGDVASPTATGSPLPGTATRPPAVATTAATVTATARPDGVAGVEPSPVPTGTTDTTATATRTRTATAEPTKTETPEPTRTATQTATATPTPVRTADIEPTADVTRTPVKTRTPDVKPTAVPVDATVAPIDDAVDAAVLVDDVDTEGTTDAAREAKRASIS